MENVNQNQPQPQQPQNPDGESTITIKTCFNVVNALFGLLLKRCIDTNPLIKTYPNVGNAAFGPRERNFVAAIIYLELFAVAVEFFILEGDTLEMLFRNTNFRIGSLNLRGAVNDVGFHERGLLLDLGGFPIAASMFVFCYCGHAVFPTVCMSMGDRRKFPKVLFICFVTSTITYGSMAVTGYVMYGEFLNSQVTLNLLLGKVNTKIAVFTTHISDDQICTHSFSN
nr:amino acid transporter AVT1I-like [Ziziphus jujuba var. spinosa]